MAMAICIRCGSIKHEPVEVCAACGFRPVSTEERVKSILLSTEDIGETYLGKSKDELLALAPLVASGAYTFDDAEVKALAAEMDAVLAIPSRTVMLGLFKDVGIPVLLAMGVAIALWLTR